MELISRSMILPSEKSIYSRKGINSCQVHDLIRDIGISKSMEENLVFTLEEGCSSNNQSTFRHLAINGNWKGDQSEFESIVDMSRVRSITVFGQWKSFFISDKMSLLRVLDFEDTTDLHDHHLKHIGKLVHLRYLSLRGCDNIFHLPDSLGNLRELQTLDVRGTAIIKLTKNIINLQKLNNLRAGMKTVDEDLSCRKVTEKGVCSLLLHLSMSCVLCCAPQFLLGNGANHRDGCTVACCYLIPRLAMSLDKCGVLVPRGMRKLKALHTLGVVNIGRHGKDVLRDIKGLTRLCKFAVTGVNKENSQELCSTVVSLSRLESLSIRSEGEPGLSGCLDESFSFPENLQSLKLYGNLVKLPECIKGQNLVKLKLRSSMLVDVDAGMEVLGNLPNLASLHLLKKVFQEGESLVSLKFPPGTFLSLVVLELDRVGKLNSVEFEQGATPKLELLQFHCSVRKSKVGLFSGLPSLPSLKEFMLYDNKYPEEFMEELGGELAKNQNGPVLKRF